MSTSTTGKYSLFSVMLFKLHDKEGHLSLLYTVRLVQLKLKVFRIPSSLHCLKNNLNLLKKKPSLSRLERMQPYSICLAFVYIYEYI